MKENPIRIIVLSFIVFAFALMVAFSWPDGTPGVSAARVAASPMCADITPDLSLAAKAAFAIDLATGAILYEKNADDQLPLASLTKLTTIATASAILSPDDVVTMTPQALTPEADGGDLSFRPGEQWKAQDLIDYTMIVSANRGAHALALAAAAKAGEDLNGFIAQMNAYVQGLGMHETFFASDTGLDISSTTAGSYGSAHDIAILIGTLVKTNPRLLEATREETRTFTSLSGYTHVAKNTSTVIGTLDGAIASKTGYTDLAGGNLAVVFEPMPGRPVAAVILGSTLDMRDADMQTLAAGAKTALKRMLICQNGIGSP